MSTTKNRLLTPPSWLAAAGVAWLFIGLAIVTAYRPYQVILCLLVWLPSVFYAWHQRTELRKALLSGPGLAFIGLSTWSAASILWSQAPNPFSTFREIIYTWLTLIPLILLARIEPEKLEKTLYACIPFCAVVAIAMLSDFFFIEANTFSTRLAGKTLINNPLEIGRYFATLTIAYFTLLPKEEKIGKSHLFFSSAMVFAILFSQSRSVWGALILAIATPMILEIKWIKLIKILGAAGAAIALTLILYPEALLKRGLSGRPSIWLSGLQLWSENPLTGLGLGSEYLVSRGDGHIFQHAHNILIHSGITIGLTGLSLFALLWLLSGRRLWKSKSEPIARCAFYWWIFASITFWVEGYNLWSKPGDTWLQIWPPIAIAIGLSSRNHMNNRIKQYHQNLLKYLVRREGPIWKIRHSAYGIAASLRIKKTSSQPKECDILLIHPSKKSFQQGRKSLFITSLRRNGLSVQEMISTSDSETLKGRLLSRPLCSVPLPLYLPAARAAYVYSYFRPKIVITERNGWPVSTFLRSFAPPETQTLHLAHGIICNQSSRTSYHDYDYYAIFGKSSLEHLRKTKGFGSTSAIFAGPYFPLPQKAIANPESKKILFLGVGPDEEKSQNYRNICEIALAWIKKNPGWILQVRPHPRGVGHPWKELSQKHSNIILRPQNEPFDEALNSITVAWCGYTNAILDCATAGIPVIPLGSGQDFFQCSRYEIPKAKDLVDLDKIMETLTDDWQLWHDRLETFSSAHIENHEHPIKSLSVAIRDILTAPQRIHKSNIQ